MTKQKSNSPKTVKAIQVHSPEMIKMGQQMTAEQIVRFLEDFRLMHSEQQGKSKLISLKVQENLLRAFRFKCEKQGLKYQTQIKKLMMDWVKE
ncbi:MAG: hypothetical protein R3E90_02310 [Marinicella sp.]|nr:hypothetical protein [Xanthomonadales bacterium]